MKAYKKRALLKLLLAGLLFLYGSLGLAGQTKVSECGQTLGSVSEAYYPKPGEKVGVEHLPKLFNLTLNLMKYERVRKFLTEQLGEFTYFSKELQERRGFPEKLDSITDGQVLLFLKTFPQFWPLADKIVQAAESLNWWDGEIVEDEEFDKYIKVAEKIKNEISRMVKETNATAEFRKVYKEGEPIDLSEPGDDPYEVEGVFSTTPRIYEDGKVKEADDLEAELIRYIGRAKRGDRFLMNVFDFDLMNVAKAIVKAQRRGVVIEGIGVDKGNYEHRPQVMDVVEYMRANKVPVVLVDSVGLNHQKQAVILSKDKKRNLVFESTGNFTQSGIGKDGDLGPMGLKSEKSIPNANIATVVRSEHLAYLAEYNIQYSLQGFKGTSIHKSFTFPKGEAWKVAGKDGNYIVQAYSPGSTKGNNNRYLLAELLDRVISPGLWSLNFAFSSQDTGDAFIRKILRDYKNYGKVDLAIVGDGPFAMAFWSQLLRLSGYWRASYTDINNGTAESDLYIPIDPKENPLLAGVNTPDGFLPGMKPEDYKAMVLDMIRVAPKEIFGHQEVELQVDEESQRVVVTSKLHIKSIGGDGWVVLMSFNLSDAAEKNQEQLRFYLDPMVASEAVAVKRWILAQGKDLESLDSQVKLRNRMLKSLEKKRKKEEAAERKK